MPRAVSVIDSTDSLHAAVLAVSFDSVTPTVNPMDQTFGKLTDLSSAEKLRGAQFPSKTIAGGVVGAPGFTPLVDPSVNDDDVHAVAQHRGVLKDAYAKVQNPRKKNIHGTSFCLRHSRCLAPHSKYPDGQSFQLRQVAVLEGGVMYFFLP